MRFIARYTTLLTLCLLVAITTSCSSLKPVEIPEHLLHQEIRAGNLVHVGDRILIATRDEQQHRFTVTDIDDQVISGKDIRIEIDDIIALETRTFSGGRTAALAGGGVLLYVGLVFLAISGGAFVL